MHVQIPTRYVIVRTKFQRDRGVESLEEQFQFIYEKGCKSYDMLRDVAVFVQGESTGIKVIEVLRPDT